MRRIYCEVSGYGGGKYVRRKRLTQKPHPTLLVMTDGAIFDPRYDEQNRRVVAAKQDRMNKRQREIAKLPMRETPADLRRRKRERIKFLRRCWELEWSKITKKSP